MIKTKFIILILLLGNIIAFPQGTTKTSLNGSGWTFALDPVKVGEKEQWFKTDFPFGRFDKVTVPHSFSVDPRYSYYTGSAWYFRKFNAPAATSGHRSVLKFDAVFIKPKYF